MTTSEFRRRLLQLLTQRAFKQDRFVLSSGKTSDFFIDCKQVALSGEGHLLVGEVFLDALKHLPPCTAVAGVELGGCSLASAVSLLSYQKGSGKDAVYVRKDAKTHGSKRLLEGDTHLEKGSSLVLLEDVVSTGGSTLRAARSLKEAGYVVSGVAALVDRLEGGREALDAAGLKFVSIYTRADFFVQ